MYIFYRLKALLVTAKFNEQVLSRFRKLLIGEVIINISHLKPA